MGAEKSPISRQLSALKTSQPRSRITYDANCAPRDPFVSDANCEPSNYVEHFVRRTLIIKTLCGYNLFCRAGWRIFSSRQNKSFVLPTLELVFKQLQSASFSLTWTVLNGENIQILFIHHRPAALGLCAPSLPLNIMLHVSLCLMFCLTACACAWLPPMRTARFTIMFLSNTPS